MRTSITLFSILMILGTASAQAAGHGGRRCKRPSHSGPGGDEHVSAPIAATGNATSTGFEEASVAQSSIVSSASPAITSVASESSTGSAEGGSISPSISAISTSSNPAGTDTAPSPVSAEASVVTTSLSTEESIPASPSSTIGGGLAVTGLSSSASATISSSIATPSASTPISSNGNTGVGLAVNSVTGPLTSFTGSGSKMSWYYNWAVGANSDSAGLEFVPMVWGEAAVTEVKGASEKWKGVTHVLGFNEPDMGSNVGGSNIAASKAATLHQEWVTNLGGQYLIGSPAVARGSKRWMDDWLAACAGKCEFDFVPFHFYGTNVDQLIDYVKEFSVAYNKPLWLTEWSCNDFSTGDICDKAEVEAFMKTAIAFFRESGLVERWAWFGAFPDLAGKGNANGIQNADGSVNDVGKLYLSL